MKKRLAITKDGRLSMCSCPESKMGRGRCTHVSVYASEKDSEEIDKIALPKAKSPKPASSKKTAENELMERLQGIFESDAKEKKHIAETSENLDDMLLLMYDDDDEISGIAIKRATEFSGTVSDKEYNSREHKIYKRFVEDEGREV